MAQGFVSGISPREGWLPIEKEQCWYCKYANFHLTTPVTLDVGICYYPQTQMGYPLRAAAAARKK